MDLNTTLLLFGIPAVIFSGISKGGFGSGASFAAAPFLALVLPPEQAVGLMLPLLMVQDVTSIRVYWRKWDPANTIWLIIAGIPGVVLGALAFGWADADTIRLMLGLISLGFVAYQGARYFGILKIAKAPFSRARALFWGMIAGFTSAVAHAGGPPSMVHLLSQDLSKERLQGTTVAVFTALNAMKVVPYAILGFFTVHLILHAAILVPIAILGTYIGIWSFRFVSARLYFTLTYFFLIVTGSKLIWDGLM